MSTIARVTTLLVVALLTLIPGISWADCVGAPLGYERYVYRLSDLPVPDTINVGVKFAPDSVVATPVSKHGRFIMVPADTRTNEGPYDIRYVCMNDAWVQVANTTLKLIDLAPDEQPIHVPPMYTAGKGETISSAAVKNGIPEDSLRAWNPTDRKNQKWYPLFENERLFLSRPEVPTARWVNPGGYPCKIDIREQVFKLHMLPEDVQKEFFSLIEASTPDTVTVVSDDPDNPFLLDGLLYGEGTVWGQTACVWADRTFMDADRWGPVDWPKENPTTRYWLYRFHVCNNGAPDSEPLPRQMAEIEVGERRPEPRATGQPPASPPDSSGGSQSPPPTVPDEWVQNGAAWVTYEVPVQRHERPHHNVYAGAIEYLRPSYSKSGLAIVAFASPANFSGINRDRTYSGNYRLGLGLALLRTGGWGVEADAGAYYDAFEVLYDREHWVSSTHLRQEKAGAMLDGAGPYIRPRIYGPRLTYFEGLLRKGQNLDLSIGANLKTEPGRMYFEAIYTYTDSKERERHVDGQTLTAPDALFRTGEGRIGVKPWRNFIAYASYSQWRFDSDFWWYDHWGPGVGQRWKFHSNWTQFADVKYHTKKDRDPETDEVFRGVEWRPSLGVTYRW